MIQPFRRPHAALSSTQVAELVRRRDAGETWMAIGRDLGRQDQVLKRAYDAAKAALAAVMPQAIAA